jgi:hypothetical protein
VYAEGAMADCTVFVDDGNGLEPNFQNSDAQFRAQSGFDGVAPIYVPDISAFVASRPSGVRFAVLPSDGCRSVATDGYLPSPMVLVVKSGVQELAPRALPITPLSTLTWMTAQLQSSTIQESIDQIRTSFGWEDVTDNTFYSMDPHAVNLLDATCGTHCLEAYGMAIQLKDTITLLDPLLLHLRQSQGFSVAVHSPWVSVYRAVAAEISGVAAGGSFSLADCQQDTACNARILSRAHSWGVSGTESLSVNTTDSAGLQPLVIAILARASAMIEETVMQSADVDTSTAQMQKITAVVGPTAASGYVGPMDAPGQVQGIVRHVQGELATHASGGVLNVSILSDYLVSANFRQQVDAVVLPGRTVHTVSGVVQSGGYFVGCRVYIDRDNDRVFDSSEPFGMTDARGRFKIEAAKAGIDSVESLVAPTQVVRLWFTFSSDNSDTCQNSFGFTPQHPMSAIVTDIGMSALSSMRTFDNSYDGTGKPSPDLIASCVRSDDDQCVGRLIGATQIETTFRLISALLEDVSASEYSWQTWRVYSVQASALTRSDFSNAAVIRSLANSVVTQRCTAGVPWQSTSCSAAMATADTVADVIVWLNRQASADAREAATYIACDEIRRGKNCTAYKGKIDGGKAIIALALHQTAVRVQLAPRVVEARLSGSPTTSIQGFRSFAMDPALPRTLAGELSFRHLVLN